MNCQICNDATDAKYKCPTCYIKYCSVACWKQHKSTPCLKPESVREEENKDKFKLIQNTLFPTDHTIHKNDLLKIGESERIKNLLRNPALRTMLQELDSSYDPQSLLEEAKREPIFLEFASACLKIVDADEI